MNTRKLNKQIIEHFSLNLSDEEFKVIAFGKENFRENKLIHTHDKSVLFIDNNIKSKVCNTKSRFEVLELFESKKNKTSLYYFIDKFVGIKKHVSVKYTFNLVSEDELNEFFLRNSFSDDIYISSSDVDALGIYLNNILIGVVSLIKFDDFYDLCMCIDHSYQNKHVGRVLLYEYLKFEKKHKTIRIMVNSDNKQMIKMLESLNLEYQAKIVEVQTEEF